MTEPAPTDLAAAVAAALAQVLPGALAQLMGPVAPETPTQTVPDSEVARQREERLAAEAEAARWAAMPPDELARHEADAAKARYRDALVDLLGRGGDPADAAPLAEPLTDADRAACVAQAREALAKAGAADAVAAIDAGLRTRAETKVDLLRAVMSGKATDQQVAQLAGLIG